MKHKKDQESYHSYLENELKDNNDEHLLTAHQIQFF